MGYDLVIRTGLPFVLASGHCMVCLDGVVVLPVAFLAITG